MWYVWGGGSCVCGKGLYVGMQGGMLGVEDHD